MRRRRARTAWRPWRFLAGVGIAWAGLALTAVPALASCLPPQMQTLNEPGLIVVSGTISDATDGAVGIVVDSWWGDQPRSSIAVKRPAADPTVISSTDWTPKVGEAWIVAGRIEGDQLVTDVCNQWPATPEGLAEVVRSLSDATTPPPSAGATSAPTTLAISDDSARSEPATLPIAAAGAVVAAAAVIVFVMLKRRVA